MLPRLYVQTREFFDKIKVAGRTRKIEMRFGVILHQFPQGFLADKCLGRKTPNGPYLSCRIAWSFTIAPELLHWSPENSRITRNFFSAIDHLKLWDLSLRLELPYTGGVPRPSGPEIPKKSQKGVSGPPGLECQKSGEKVPNDPNMSQKDYKISVRGLFDTFLTLRERLFETFWGFRGSGVWRLLYMGLAIVNLSSLGGGVSGSKPQKS